MAEYIEREAAIAETRKPRLTDAELRRRLARIPAADVQPVVRCRDCKYCSPGLTREERSIPDADLICAYWESDGLDANDFCSRGERKGGNE